MLNHARVFRLDIALPVIVASAGLFGTIYANVPIIRGLATIALIGVMVSLIVGSITLSKMESEDGPSRIATQPTSGEPQSYPQVTNPPVTREPQTETIATPLDQQITFGHLRDDIHWIANRSAFRWLEPAAAVSYPVEYARVAKREAELYKALSGLGIDMPSYGDGRWRKFWVELVFASERKDLDKARGLLDELGPSRDRSRPNG